ncbi:MAG: hypothetical protein IIU32_01190 [Firmicutes bacterium]|nr:hypothetical protein [Bacillota bacterium]
MAPGSRGRSCLNVSGYIDRMMGEGYAAEAGVVNIPVFAARFSFWNPVVWLLLFIIVLAAFFLAIIGSSGDRASISSAPADAEDGKYATFFSGEKSMPSHVSGSDLFWGFKKNWKGYFKVMDGIHSGRVNDYALYVVCAAALITVFVFGFVR